MNLAYATAMKEVSAKHQDNVLATFLYVETLMNLQPWARSYREGNTAEIDFGHCEGD